MNVLRVYHSKKTGFNKSTHFTQYLYTSDIFTDFLNIKVEFMPFYGIFGQNCDRVSQLIHISGRSLGRSETIRGEESRFVTAPDINCIRDAVYPMHVLCGNPHFPHGYPQKWGAKPLFWRVFGGFSTSCPIMHNLCPQTSVYSCPFFTLFRA